jgi:NAD(P)H dehydrogenase (quinone)
VTSNPVTEGISNTDLVLVTGSTGDTGRPTVKLLLERGFRVRALARSHDDRSKLLSDLGAEVFVGNMLDLKDVRSALDGVSRAYFVYPMAEGLVTATAVFAQASKEQHLDLVVNMSHKQSRPKARSAATLDHWLAEQVFNWSGVPVTHLRVTFFAEWLLYSAAQIRLGRYVTPFDADSRFALIAASDIARVVVGLLQNPAEHAGKIYPLHGPVEYSHKEAAALVGEALGKELRFEQVSVPDFLELIGLLGDPARTKHFEAVRIDQQEGLLAGTDTFGAAISGQPLKTVEEFVREHRDILS